jgi:tripartite-type tricarboxylate transporter receptor subunit TctC
MRPKPPSRRVLLAGGIAVLAAPAIVRAQGSGAPLAFQGPITILSPFPPGGSTDLMARLIADRIAVTLGRTVLVDSQSGAGGRIAARTVQSAPPNGSRLLLANTSVMAITPIAFTDAGYDPVGGFAPVAGVSEFAAGLATGPLTGPGGGVTTLPGLKDWLAANPSQANYGVPALGSLPHLTGIAFSRAMGIPLTVVPYRGGAPIVQDLVGGRLAIGIAAAADFAAQHQAGQVRLLGVTGKRRAPGVDDVPTFAEAGVGALETNAWNGVFAPAGTPADTVRILNEAIVKALGEPEVRTRLEQSALIPTPTGPAELAGWLTRDRAFYAPLIAAAGPLQ